MTEARCPECGHANPASANYCSSCGAELHPAHDRTTGTYVAPQAPETPDDHSALDPGDLPAGQGMLVVTRGPKAGSRVALDQPVTTAGRHPKSDIFLDDITVSRRHAEIVREDGVYRARDAGSLNGTYVNKERIDGDVVLNNGDQLQVGRFKLVFFVGGG